MTERGQRREGKGRRVGVAGHAPAALAAPAAVFEFFRSTPRAELTAGRLIQEED